MTGDRGQFWGWCLCVLWYVSVRSPPPNRQGKNIAAVRASVCFKWQAMGITHEKGKKHSFWEQDHAATEIYIKHVDLLTKIKKLLSGSDGHHRGSRHGAGPYRPPRQKIPCEALQVNGVRHQALVPGSPTGLSRHRWQCLFVSPT